MKAVWNDTVLAESGDTIVIEGNHYFPADSIKSEFFEKSSTRTICPWKGEATYYKIAVDGKENLDSAWSYPDPKDAAKEIKDYIAFWKGITVIE